MSYKGENDFHVKLLIFQNIRNYKPHYILGTQQYETIHLLDQHCYGSESRTLRRTDEIRSIAEMRFVSTTVGYTVLGRKANKIIMTELQLPQKKIIYGTNSTE
jgi:hypothetical protein